MSDHAPGTDAAVIVGANGRDQANDNTDNVRWAMNLNKEPPFWGVDWHVAGLNGPARLGAMTGPHGLEARDHTLDLRHLARIRAIGTAHETPGRREPAA